MPRCILVVVTAVLAAGPALSADADKRKAERPSPSWFVATPSEVVTSLGDDNGKRSANKPKRVRYTIPAPTRM